MTICFFGNYIPDYPRVVVLKKGFEQNGVKVLECHTRKTGLRKFFELWKQHQKMKNNYDILLVGMASYTLVWFAKFLTKKPIIFDAFVSLKLTGEDRGTSNFGAFWDKFGCRFADKILLDTNAQIDYFVDQYGLDRKKFIRVFAGADDKIFFPNLKSQIKNQKFTVHWHGHIVPFHGLETVVGAANKLRNYKDIEFRITTRFNSKYQMIKNMVGNLGLENVKFFPETSYQGLAQMMNQADVCLGIFGANQKAKVVIPNKIFEAVACRRAVITADTSAVREVFDKNSIAFCEPANAEDLVRVIKELKFDGGTRENLAENAYRIFQEQLRPKIIVKNLMLTVARPFMGR